MNKVETRGRAIFVGAITVEVTCEDGHRRTIDRDNCFFSKELVVGDWGKVTVTEHNVPVFVEE